MQERIFLCFVVGFIKIKKRGSLDINELLTPVTAECSVVWLIRKLSTPNLLLITLLMTREQRWQPNGYSNKLASHSYIKH